MRRRQLLRMSGLPLIVPLGGCGSIGGEATESKFTFTQTGKIAVENRTSEFARSYPGQEPFTEIVLGEKSEISDNLHGVEIYNDYENPVEISLTVNRESDDHTFVFEGEGIISTDEYMAIAITRPATYINEIEMRGEGVDLEKTFDVPRSAWEAGPKDDKGISPEHNIHLKKNEIEVRFVGEER